jgi:glycosyltransferase involved in cell wall biosynthesis
MKINYLAYLDPYRYSGGGEQVNRKIIEAARARGHEVRITSMEGVDQHASPDIWYLCDVYNCPSERNATLHGLIDSIVRGSVPYVHHDNSYVDLCWYGAIPCNGQGMDGFSCHIKGAGCSVLRAAPLYHNASLCSFMSPLHRDVHIGAMGKRVLSPGKTLLVPPSVDVSAFRNHGGERDIPYLSYGGQSEAKGYHNVMKSLPRGSVTFIGGSSRELLKPEDGRYLGSVPQGEMPQLLNRTRNYVHLPRWPEPFGLIVAEAALCGCNLIVNENVGAASWKLDLTDPRIYEDSCGRYWTELESKLRCQPPVSPC